MSFREIPQIIALWAVPRSMSTTFEKAISGHPRIKVLHEPFTDCFYFGPERRSHRYGDSVSVARFDRSAAKELILGASKATGTKTFFKELAFQAYRYVDDDFLSQITNTFLIRHPKRVIASLIRLKPDFTEEELGFQALNELYDRVISLQDQAPTVIEGEQFRANPQFTLEYFCSIHGLDYQPEMLNWRSGLLRAWLPHEVESQKKWHDTLEKSQTILPPISAPASLELCERQSEMYRRAEEIYTKIVKHALTVPTSALFGTLSPANH